jgi:hypothetical protein
MSHFLVFVIGDDVESQLAPYHEFECTGRIDEYVKEVNITEKVRADYKATTVDRVVLPDGSREEVYQDRFYRDPTEDEQEKLGDALGVGMSKGLVYTHKDWGDGKGYRVKVHDPSIGGGKVVKFQAEEVMTFIEFCGYNYGLEILEKGDNPDFEGIHRFGWVTVDENGEVVEVIDRTNPNSKWDWWVIGGRWGNYLPLRDGTKDNSATLGDIDFEGAFAEARMKAYQDFSAWETITEELGRPGSLEECQEMMKEEGREAVHAFYVAQPAIKKFYAENKWTFYCPVREYGFDSDAYADRVARSVLVPFALVKDGEWFQSGKIGWFGFSSNEKDPDEWAAFVRATLADLPSETMITVVDCHV